MSFNLAHTVSMMASSPASKQAVYLVHLGLEGVKSNMNIRILLPSKGPNIGLVNNPHRLAGNRTIHNHGSFVLKG